MAITESFNGSAVTVSTTETSLTGGSTVLQAQTTAGVYQLFLDVTNMASGDQYKVRIYEKVLTGGSQRVVHEDTLSGVQLRPNYATPALALMWGFDFSLIKVKGTDRAFDWSIRKAA